MITGTTARESVATVNIWLWESIWGGWVLIFYLLNNMFAWKIFYHTRVRWLVVEVLFPPTVDVIYSMYNSKRKTYSFVFCSLNVLSFLTHCTYAVSFVCIFHMQSNQTIIEYKISIVLCVNCTMGAAILHDQVQQMIYGHVKLAWHGDICSPTTFPGNASYW